MKELQVTTGYGDGRYGPLGLRDEGSDGGLLGEGLEDAGYAVLADVGDYESDERLDLCDGEFSVEFGGIGFGRWQRDAGDLGERSGGERSLQWDDFVELQWDSAHRVGRK